MSNIASGSSHTLPTTSSGDDRSGGAQNSRANTIVEDAGIDDSPPPLAEDSDWSTDDSVADDSEEESEDDVVVTRLRPRSDSIPSRSGSIPSLQSVSDSSESMGEETEESDEEGSEVADEEASEFLQGFAIPAGLRLQLEDLARSGLGPQDLIDILLSAPRSQQALDNDPKRAEILLSGLETVPTHLVRRYEELRKADGSPDDGCIICRDDFTSESDSPSPDDEHGTEPFSELPFHPTPTIILVFPCPGRHLFHHDCLSPWLARKTTCPTCRFDIDPDSLTLRKSPLRTQGGPATQPAPERSWHPPRVVSLVEWLEDEEYFREHGVRHERVPQMTSDVPAGKPSASLTEESREGLEDEWIDEDEPVEAAIPTTAELLAHLANTTQPAYPYLTALAALRASSSDSRSQTTLPRGSLQVRLMGRRGAVRLRESNGPVETVPDSLEDSAS